MDAEAWDALEVLKITRHQFQIVIDGGGRDLEIRILQELSSARKPGVDLPVDTSDAHVERKDGDGRKDPRLYVRKVPFGVRRSEGTPKKLPDRDGACELI